MLVLTRKKGERIVIGDGIYVTVVDIRGDQVQLGIEAPKEITIHREEIYKEIQAENIRARVSTSEAVAKVQKLLKRKEKD